MKAIKSIKEGVSKGAKSPSGVFRMQCKTYFLTYRGMTDSGDRITKEDLVDHLVHRNPRDRKLKPQKYLVCQEMYDDGQPHFHAILTYPRIKAIEDPTYYDYLGIHPNIQPMRNMKAALEYVRKQDTHPVTNMDMIQERRVARARDTSSLYQLLQEQMVKDPFTFDVDRYCTTHGLFKHIYKANYHKALTLIKRAQPAYARMLLRSKPGIRLITPQLIAQRLNSDELRQYHSHPCYQRIIDHINEIHRYPNLDVQTMAPSKTPHLLIVGDSSIGKSALVDHRASDTYPYPGLMHYYACYHLSIGENWFPPYRSFDYRMARWNQFTIDSDLFPKKGYNRLLDYLEGAPSALPQKGRPPVERQDNPKHIMTSNRTLQQHISKTFHSQDSRAMSRRNLGTRIDCVVIPKGKEIHFLRKLFVVPD